MRLAISLFCGVASAGCARSAIDEPKPHHVPHWGYDGAEGPAAWGGLASEYRQCETGHQQSPVALAVEQSEPAALPPLEFHYGRTAIEEVHNGHTIQDQILVGESLELSGKRYRLEQFHFHHPSEHTLDGVSYPLEIHFVHRDAAGALLVIGVLVGQGAVHPDLGVLFDKLPHEHEHVRLAIDPESLLPADRHYVTYSGSLTTPPCTEGVTWIVMTSPIEASPEQVQRFAAAFPHNNRPLMPLEGRRVRAAL